jgi:hypothetical protein
VTDGTDSTLIRRAAEASTFNEIAAFAKMIEQRPIDLLEDLAGVEFLSGAKFEIAKRTLRRRVREMKKREIAAIRDHLTELERADPAVAGRLRALLGLAIV